MYIAGLFVVLFGVAFFLRNLGVIYFPGSFWGLFWPLVVVGLGLAIICVTHEGRKLLRKIKDLFKA